MSDRVAVIKCPRCGSPFYANLRYPYSTEENSNDPRASVLSTKGCPNLNRPGHGAVSEEEIVASVQRWV